MKVRLFTLLLIIIAFFAAPFSVSAGDEYCTNPALPICWGSRSVDQWDCMTCSSMEFRCAGDTSISCSGSSDPYCATWGYGGPCINLCVDTSGSGGCEILNVPVVCDTSYGHCNSGVYVSSCFTDTSGCHEATNTLGCCGPNLGPTPTLGASVPTPVPSCSCTSWLPQPCGSGGCAANQRYDARTCNPAGCDATTTACYDSATCTGTCVCTPWVSGACGTPNCPVGSRYSTRNCTDSLSGAVCDVSSVCAADPTCPTSAVSCNLYTLPTLYISGVGQTATTVATVENLSGGTITGISFTSNNSAVASTPNVVDTVAPYQATFTGVSLGTTFYTATAYMSDGSTMCLETAQIIVSTTPAWYQALGGNVITGSRLEANIPATAINFNFIRDPISLLVYNYLTTPDLDSGAISTSLLVAKSAITSRPEISFSLLYTVKLPEDVRTYKTDISSTFASNSIAISNLGLCNTARGYRVCYYDGLTSPSGVALGDLTLTGNYTLPDGMRIILYVDNADVTLQGKIKPLTRGRSSFMLISEGDISVDPAVGGSPEEIDHDPDLEGIFYTDGTFSSGHVASGNDVQLHIRGSVVAEVFNLARNLGSGAGEVNEFYPGELFEYGTEQVMAFPPFLRLRSTSWTEVNP